MMRSSGRIALLPEVKIGKGCELLSHVVVSGNTQLGEYNRVSPLRSLEGARRISSLKGFARRTDWGS